METTEFFERVLAETPLFKGLDPKYIRLLAGCAKNTRFSPGDTIYVEGNLAESFFIVREGNVAIDVEAQDRGTITVQTLTTGDVLGWSWLFPPYEWQFGARAVDDTRAIALDATCLRGKCDTDPVLGYEMMKRFSSIMLTRLHATRLQLMDVYGTGASKDS